MKNSESEPKWYKEYFPFPSHATIYERAWLYASDSSTAIGAVSAVKYALEGDSLKAVTYGAVSGYVFLGSMIGRVAIKHNDLINKNKK